MPSDSAGNYTLVSSYFVQNGDTVLPVQHNPVFEDVAAGLSNRIMKDGRTVMTGDLKMGGNKTTGLVDGSDPGDSVRFNQIASIGSIAAGATMDIGAKPEPVLNVTGTGGPVMSMGIITAGVKRTLVFEDVATLTHNATSLVLPGGANIITATGDVAVFVSEGSGNWRCAGYQRANGGAFVQNFEADEISTDVLEDRSTGDSVGAEYLVHGSAKAWGLIGASSATLSNSFNASSIVDLGTGNFLMNLTAALNSISNPTFATNAQTATGLGVFSTMFTTSQLQTVTQNTSGAATDSNRSCLAFGDLA